MYSQIGDAVGTMGKGQEVIPIQDERGYVVAPAPGSDVRERNRAESAALTFGEGNGNGNGFTNGRSKLRRASKRDSGIMLPPSPLLHERSNSLPFFASPTSAPANFNFERMEANLAKIEKLMERNASQLRSLEHVQAANLERLTSALVQNAEMIRELGIGQRVLGEACEELRLAATARANERDREGKRERQREREKERDRERERQIQEEKIMERVTFESLGSGSEGCACEVKKGPRKIGRTVVGYVYKEDKGVDRRKSVGPGVLRRVFP